MAAVHGPIPASHHSPFRSTHSASYPRVAYPKAPAPSVKPLSTQPTSNRQDPFHGHEQNSKLCARFITHLFACPEYPPSSSNSTVKLSHFIAYALHRTKLHVSVTFAALVLLQRLKARFPTARGSSGHRLFISAFMLASKVICDDTYSNKSWSIVAQGMFQLREINQMEREMCQYLEWELNVDPVTLWEFEEMIRKDFVGPGPYPTYILPSTKKSTPPPTATSSHSGVPEGTTSVTSRFQLPAPVTTNDDTSRLKGRVNVERSAVPPLIALTSGLAAVSSSQPRAVLLFIGAGTVILGIYFVVPPKDGEKTYPVMSAFLRRLPDVFTAAGCTLVVLGIGTAFPDEVALIPLFSFISLAALALLSGAILTVWVTVALYGAALCSLVAFVVLAFMA